MQLSEKKALKIYFIGTIFQIFIVCLLIAILKWNQISYPKIFDLLFLIVGGVSSAMWGIIVSIKYKLVDSPFKILKDFFNVKQSPWHYCMVAFFIIIIFGTQLFGLRVLENIKWYSFFILFLQSIILGGIEEIGWRYTYQPIIEKKLSFELSCILTFFSWALWHYMYFFITNSLGSINHAAFLIGLLGNCFILGAIYKVSNSLWLCVLYHCLLNVFSQTLYANSFLTGVISNGISILFAVIMVRKCFIKQK